MYPTCVSSKLCEFINFKRSLHNFHWIEPDKSYFLKWIKIPGKIITIHFIDISQEIIEWVKNQENGPVVSVVPVKPSFLWWDYFTPFHAFVNAWPYQDDISIVICAKCDVEKGQFSPRHIFFRWVCWRFAWSSCDFDDDDDDGGHL